MYVGISALKDGTRLSFNCSADFALYSKNISFYFKPDGSKEKNITQNPTFGKNRFSYLLLSKCRNQIKLNCNLIIFILKLFGT